MKVTDRKRSVTLKSRSVTRLVPIRLTVRNTDIRRIAARAPFVERKRDDKRHSVDEGFRGALTSSPRARRSWAMASVQNGRDAPFGVFLSPSTNYERRILEDAFDGYVL